MNTELSYGETGLQENVSSSNPWDTLKDVKMRREMPAKSPDLTCDLYIRDLRRHNRMPVVEDFVNEALDKDYQEFVADTAELENFKEEYSGKLDAALDYDTKEAIREYSNNGYKAMNQVARGQWNYDILGRQTPEALAHARELNEKIYEAILDAPSPDIDMVTYRGTNLSTFLGYKVDSVADLKKMENQFFFEGGFCSTSLLKDKSFQGGNYEAEKFAENNVGIKYLIPKGSHECIGLLKSNLSKYPEENEILINNSSLSYVSEVEVAPDGESAQVTMVLIPRKVYDPVYEKRGE